MKFFFHLFNSATSLISKFLYLCPFFLLCILNLFLLSFFLFFINIVKKTFDLMRVVGSVSFKNLHTFRVLFILSDGKWGLTLFVSIKRGDRAQVTKQVIKNLVIPILNCKMQNIVAIVITCLSLDLMLQQKLDTR